MPTSPELPLDDRKVRILRSIVADFVARGEPVGSRRVVEQSGLDVSSATVRNEMAALEALGLIGQPHTSAGRIPTDKGYRVFVDHLERRTATEDDPRRLLVRDLLTSAGDVEELLARTSGVLSQLTRLVALVVAPAVDAARLKLVELVSLTPGAMLLLLVDDTGRVVKRRVEVDGAIADADVDRVRAALNEHVRGRRMREVHDAVLGLLDDAPSELRDLLTGIATATVEGVAAELVRRVLVGGTAALAGEDTFERESLSRLLTLLEERATLAAALEGSATTDAPSVRIGGEHDVEGLEGTALVAQRYLVEAGALGVLGPTRMDYASVLAIVRAVSAELEDALTRMDV